MPFNPTIKENLSRVKNILTVKQFLEFNNYTFKNNRCVCPYCNNTKLTLTLLNQENRFNCFSCGAKGDILDLACKFYNTSPQFAINELISLTGIQRYTGDFNIKSKQEKFEYHHELDFIKEASSNITEISEKLDGLKLLHYDKIQSETREDIFDLLDNINSELEQLKLCKYTSKKYLRNLYRKAKYYCDYIENLKKGETNENT